MDVRVIRSELIDLARAEGKVYYRSLKQLSQYCIDKAKKIVTNNPTMSQRKLVE